MERPLLAAPQQRPDILVVAGEHSGDQHAAQVVRELCAAQPATVVAALGGEALEQAGAELLFDLTAHAVVGVVEVLKHYGFFRQLMDETVALIRTQRPQVVVLVDYPGFNLRLAAALKQAGVSRSGGGDVAVYMYVSPQIWAWKAHRRFKMAQMLDELGVIFPFETAIYADTTLPVHFVGHPMVQTGHALPVSYAADGPILLLPGSREQPIRRIFPVLAAAAEHWLRSREALADARFVTLYPGARLRALLIELVAAYPLLQERLSLIATPEPVAARAVLTSSGTMALSCALAGLPGAIVYRAHPLTYLMGRLVVKIRYLGMMNLLLERPMYPEFIQGAAQPAGLAAALTRLTQDPAIPTQAQADAAELRSLLQQPAGTSAAQRIGAWLTGHTP